MRSYTVYGTNRSKYLSIQKQVYIDDTFLYFDRSLLLQKQEKLRKYVQQFQNY